MAFQICYYPNTYTINYNANKPSGSLSTLSGSTANTTALYDTNVTLRNNGYTLSGYTFKEWNTKADGSGTSYKQGATLTKPNFTATNNGTVNLYAIWTPNTNTSYQVEYYLERLGKDYNTLDTNNYYLGESCMLSATTDSIQTIAQKTFTGFTYYTQSYNNSVQQSAWKYKIDCDGNTVIKVYYKRNAYNYTVNHYVQNVDDNNYSLTHTDTIQNVKWGSTITLADTKKTNGRSTRKSL